MHNCFGVYIIFYENVYFPLTQDPLNSNGNRYTPELKWHLP